MLRSNGMNQKGFAQVFIVVVFLFFIGLIGVVILIKQSSSRLATIATVLPKGLYVKTLYPSSGPIGTMVVISGSGFTPNQNVVKFGSDYSEYLDSPDGVTLKFIVPSEADECHPSGNPCYEKMNKPITPGQYSLVVMNYNGISNAVTFDVSGDSSVQTFPKGYRCQIPCTGVAPSEKVVLDCARIFSQEQCTTYKSDEFPYRCGWMSTDYQCPPLP